MGSGKVHSANTYFCRRRSLRGLSFLEFAGFLTALSVGVVLGSMYLGVDVKTLALGVLEKTELIESGQSPDSVAASATDSTEGQAETVPQPSDSNSTVAADAAEPTRTRTVQYWTSLAEIVQQESTGRLRSLKQKSRLPLLDYLTHRQQSHRQAADAIAALGKPDIDARVLAHAENLLRWHRAGANLYGQAAEPLNSVTASQLSGPVAKAWQSRATQHRMEEKLLATQHQTLIGYLQHAYGQMASGGRQPAD